MLSNRRNYMSNENEITMSHHYPTRRSLRKKRNKKRNIITVGVSTAVALSMATIGLGTSFAYPHKTIRFELDGKTQKVSTWASNVDEVLKQKNINLKKQDKVIPSKNTPISAGDEIVVNRAKEAFITIKGVNKKVWTTASSSKGIANQFSRLDDTVSVAARSSFRDGSDAELVEKDSKIKVVHDGQAQYVTAKPNEDAEKILKKINVQVSPIDKVKLETNATETVLTVQRVQRDYITESEPIKFESKVEKDAQLPAGEIKKTQEGKDGEKEISKYTEKIDGNLVHQGEVVETIKNKPVEEIVKLGVKGIDDKKIPDDQQSLQKLVKTGSYKTLRNADSDVPNVSTNYSGQDPRALAQPLVAARGWSDSEYRCLLALWQKESNWNPNSYNSSSGATGIPQALPGSKMASAGADWRTNPITQIRWGLGYIAGRYGTPCNAWGHSQSRGWY